MRRIQGDVLIGCLVGVAPHNFNQNKGKTRIRERHKSSFIYMYIINICQRSAWVGGAANNLNYTFNSNRVVVFLIVLLIIPPGSRVEVDCFEQLPPWYRETTF